ncbi:MAG: preprotein translocase subunit SecE [Candidatus Paceibacterota bacterium]
MSLFTYLQESKAEMRHVNWPTSKQTVIFTVLVVIISLVIAFFLGFFDFLFSRLLDLLIV